MLGTASSSSHQSGCCYPSERSVVTMTVFQVSHFAQRALLVLACSSLGVVAGGVRAQTPLPGIVVVVEGASRAVRPVPRAPVVRQATVEAGAAAASAPESAEGNGAPQDAPVARELDFAGQLSSSIGTATSVVTGEELSRRQTRTPVEALSGLPGVAVSRTGSPAGLTQVRIRGAEGNHTLVLIDGMEANSPADGEFDFSNIVGTDDIERIEVLKGVQSGLYGSGAIGGVVNIVTRSGKGPLRVAGAVEAGSFGTRQASALVSGGNDRAWGLLSVATRKMDGFNIAPAGNERDGSLTTTSFLKAGISPVEGLTIEGSLRQTRKDGQRDEENYFVPGVLIQQIDAPSRFSADMWLGALEGKLTLLGGAWMQSLRMESRALTADDLSINPAFAPFSLYDRYRSTSDLYRYTSTFRLDTPGLPDVRHYVTGLLESRRDGFVLFTDDNIDHERRTRSFAGEVRGEYWRMLDLSASVRHDDSDVFADATTWRTAASLKIPTTPFRLHASAGTGIKLPSLFEQYGRIPNFFSPNPNLVPERAEGWDAGVELSLLNGRAILDATWFSTDVTGKIQRVNGGTTVRNLDGVSTREGIELSGKVNPLPGLVLSASYAWVDAQEPNGLAELRRPAHTARLDADYEFASGRGRIGVTALYNGSLVDEALRTSNPFIFPLMPERVTLGDYWLVSARAAWKLTPGVEVFARVENVLDQRYQEIYGFEAPGLAAYAGMKVSLEPLGK